jgi:hypothetical protein
MYDAVVRPSSLANNDEALDMKSDWKVIYPFQR